MVRTFLTVHIQRPIDQTLNVIVSGFPNTTVISRVWLERKHDDCNPIKLKVSDSYFTELLLSKLLWLSRPPHLGKVASGAPNSDTDS